jgi:hypothetical protein
MGQAVRAKEQKIKELNESISAVRFQLDSARTEKDNLQEQLSKQGEKGGRGYQGKLDSLEERHRNLERILSERTELATKEKQAHEAEALRLKGELADYEEMLRASQKEAEKLTAARDALARDRDQLAEDIRRLRQEFEENIREYDRKLEEMVEEQSRQDEENTKLIIRRLNDYERKEQELKGLYDTRIEELEAEIYKLSQ